MLLEDDLQRLLYQFNTTAKKFETNISATKTSSEPVSDGNQQQIKNYIAENEILVIEYLGKL